MTPSAIVAQAQRQRLDIIGVVDHNAAGNASAAAAAGERQRGDARVRVLPGLEIESAEGVHVVCLCDHPAAALELQDFVWAHLPDRPNSPARFGEQVLTDAEGRPTGREERLLLQSSRLGLEDLCGEGHARGFLVLAAHVNRRAYGVLGVLGFLPQGLAVDGLEGALQSEAAGHPSVHSSDAHRLDEIGQVWTDFWIAEPTIAELRLALLRSDGRRTEVAGPAG